MAASVLNSRDLHWKFIKALDKKGRPILRKVLYLGTITKPDTTHLLDYLKDLPPESSANYVKVAGKYRRFNATQSETIRNDPSYENFDITLLVLCILLACENVAEFQDSAWYTEGPELENCIYVIKRKRNDAMHQIVSMTHVQLMDKISELREIFKQTLREAHKRYPAHFTSTELNVDIQDVDMMLDEISNEIISQEDLVTLCSRMLLYDLEPLCRRELLGNYQSMKNINPVSFITGVILKLDVSHIFTDMEIDHLHHRHQTAFDPIQERWISNIVSYRNFFVEVERSLGTSHQGIRVVMLEGLAGAGKTTMIRLMVKQWCDIEGTIAILDTYQVVLHVMALSPSTQNFEDLIQCSLPDSFLKYRSLLKPLLTQCKVLILVDGFDEATASMIQMLTDIICHQENHNITIVCTSRPERSETFHGLVTSCGPHLKVIYTRIKGVPVNKRVELIEKTHKQMKQETGSGVDTKLVVQQLQDLVKSEHYRLPLNITLAVYVCDQEPGILKANATQTELYTHTFRLSKLKLVKERLIKYPEVLVMSEKQRYDRIEEWYNVMDREQFLALSKDKLILPEDAIERLREKSRLLNLPEEEMLGTFLSLKSITPKDPQYSAPHKGLQEFCSARHVMRTLLSEKGPHSVREILRQAGGDLIRYQNMLNHVVGLIHHQPQQQLQRLPEKVVTEVITLLAESGVRNREQWLDLIIETNASHSVLTEIGTQFKTGDDFRSAIEVNDSWVHTYIKLLPVLPTSWVNAQVSTHLQQLVPYLVNHTVVVDDDNIYDLLTHLPRPSRLAATINKRNITCQDPVLTLLGNHKYTNLQLWHEFRHPCTTNPATHHILQKSSVWDEGLRGFSGQLSEVVRDRQLNSTTLTNLDLSVASNDMAIDLTSLLHTLTHLKCLSIHVTVDVSPEIVTALPNSCEVKLYLSDVSADITDWAVDMTTALAPTTLHRYGMTHFPRSTLNQEGWTNLITSLAKHKVRVKEVIYVPLEIITDEQRRELSQLTKTKLGAMLVR
ncbi:hypothetical protein Pmani_006356 [Petrolisthes manimaculis]|uniref:NACHT domain-containing protein n=1 Tax=Petrolisthes manimaculis TaxID=1843537 RepID=A0AAE1UGJ5_9EUCA|nr:hypothetical protein Pmani_006356 [Petrolisthes manimaculis]